jgi:hypothetical protein
MVPAWLRRAIIAVDAATYPMVVSLLWPINALLAGATARLVTPGSVLHVSGPVHIAYDTVEILRAQGVRADYLAVGRGGLWRKADFRFRPVRIPIVSALAEAWVVWRVVSRYEIVHAHFALTVTRSGWEWPLLKRMGRRLVVHYRGCEIRDRGALMRAFPEVNICQDCDYVPRLCEAEANVTRRRVARTCGDAFLVTTPDLLAFAPGARHIRFFAPIEPLPVSTRERSSEFKIVHATNHPGIEGTLRIQAVIDSLVAKGFRIRFVRLHGVPHRRVLDELRDADLTIGKMKMGHYANAQIESLAAGVPAIAWVRDEFVTDEIRSSGLIISSLDALESTLEHLLRNPEQLEAKRRVARDSVARLHPNAEIAAELKAVYRQVRAR